MIRLLSIIGVVAVSIVIAFSAQAAKLQDVDGNVKVNKGQGYQVARSGMKVNPGDKILVGEDAYAEIAYTNGQIVPVTSGEVFTVSAAPVAAGGVATAGIPTAALIAGGGAIAVGGAVALIVSQNNNKHKDSKPSP